MMNGGKMGLADSKGTLGGMSVAPRLAVLIAAACLGSCAPAVREIVRDSLDESTREANWKKLRAPVRALAGEAAQGIIEAGTSSDVGPKLDAAADRFVRTVLHAASEELDAEISPAMARAVRASVDAALAAIASDGTIRRAEDIADALTAAAMAALARGIRDQVGPAIASALDQSLGPAMQRVIQNDVGPAVAATLQKDLTPALVDATRRASTAAAEGFVDGVRNRAEPLVDQELARIRKALDGAEQDAHSIARSVVIAVLGSLVGVLAIALWLRHRTAVAARAALHLVTREIGELRTEGAIQELGRRIKTAGEGSAAGTFLAAHLRAHPSSKFHPPPAAWEVPRQD
jgi:uncharacterized protein YidB (DUF937 family)